jgi:cytochrome oxidase assembly protein ShyY1
LLTRRWLAFLVAVGLSAYLAWWLGQWQFDRLDERREQNSTIERNERAGPVPVAEVMREGRPVKPADEWRIVTATGEYAVGDTVLVRYRTRKGRPGADVVVPLVLADGTALAVDRGWIATENAARTPGSVPPPPSGEVTVTGWVRVDATGPSTRVDDGSTRAISSAALGEALDRSFLGGFVDLATESPEPDESPTPAEPPDLGDGPHLFYGLQWWFFGLLAIAGFVKLAADEFRGRSLSSWGTVAADTRASDTAQQSTVDRDHDSGEVRRGR